MSSYPSTAGRLKKQNDIKRALAQIWKTKSKRNDFP